MGEIKVLPKSAFSESEFLLLVGKFLNNLLQQLTNSNKNSQLLEVF